MKEVLIRTWIPGTPRGYGDAKTASAWISSITTALAGLSVPSLEGLRLSLKLDFYICACGSAYRGQNRLHGPDLDNLIKQTIDGLSMTKSEAMTPGMRLIPDDSTIYEITATKQLARNDDEAGMFLTIWAID